MNSIERRYKAMLSEKIKSIASEVTELDALTEIMGEADAMETQLSEAATKISELEGTIAELRDVNMKLFINQTQSVEDDIEDEKTPDEVLDELFAEII